MDGHGTTKTERRCTCGPDEFGGGVCELKIDAACAWGERTYIPRPNNEKFPVQTARFRSPKNTSSASARGRSVHDIQLHLDGDLQKPTGGG